MWKKVDGFPNYEVSDIGEIKNTKTGKVLAPKKSKDGYLRVTLSDNGFQKTNCPITDFRKQLGFIDLLRLRLSKIQKTRLP